MNQVWFRWVVLAFALLTVARAQTSDLRFSQTLKTEERSTAGLDRLSSDEVAVIDALVRRDTATRLSSAKAEKQPSRFSERLTANERTTAGLQKLNETELPKLDAAIDAFQSAKLARALLAPPAFYSARASRFSPVEKKKEREIHGSFSLSYGMGSGGYSEKTGSMVLTMEDPDRGYAISVGYSESHIKGGGPMYRDPYYRDPFYRDPFYDPLRAPLDPVVTRP